MTAGVSNLIEASTDDNLPIPDDPKKNEPDFFKPLALDPNHKMQLVWKRFLTIGIGNLLCVYGACLLPSAKLPTAIFTLALHMLGILSITAGCHRLWSHRAYKAKLPLRVLRMVLQSMTGQGHIIWWARDHRVHHKYSDTDADPYNANRGFFFSQIGWLMVEKHPDVISAGKRIDVSDLYSDPVILFQKKYYLTIMLPIFWILLPMMIPYHLWGETLTNGFLICVMFRWMFSLHVTALVNSVAHKWGNKPYEKAIYPTEGAIVSFITLGEGWHNYHHVFPWDYRTAELGRYSTSLSTSFIDLMAKIGWAYDLKAPSREMIMARIARTGDGS